MVKNLRSSPERRSPSCFDMLMLAARAFALSLAGAGAALASAQVSYKKDAELPPLRVSFAAVQAVLDKTDKLVASANSGAGPTREELVMKSGTIHVTVPGHNLTSPSIRTPDRLESLTYSYLIYSSAPTYIGSNVTRVHFDFSDYRRTLTVEGPSPEHVDAVFAAAREDLLAMSSPIGGSGARMLFGPFAYWLLASIIGWSAHGWFRDKSRSSLTVLVASASVLLLVLVLPTADLLAGFFAVRGDPSFMIRYGPEISFVGLLIAILLAPLTVLQLVPDKQAQRAPAHPEKRQATHD